MSSLQSERRLARAETTQDSSPEPKMRVAWLIALGVAVTIAAYIGFRLPSLYAVTLYNITLEDGAWRRGLLGTVLAPLFSLFNYQYWAMALVAVTFLVSLLMIAFIVSWRSRWDAQRLLLVFWLLSPAGGFFFHEVGYSDQLIYLIFIVSAILVARVQVGLASLTLSISVLIHEITLFTSLPLLVLFAALRSLAPSRFLWFIPPVLVGLVLAAAPQMPTDQNRELLDSLSQRLAFEVRPDAVTLFARNLSETWELDFYSPITGLTKVLPLVLVSAVAVAGILFLLREQMPLGRRRLVALVALASTALPYSLVFFGWDFDRWMFLGLTNFLIVVLLLFQRSDAAPSVAAIGLALAPIMLLFYVPLTYFDGFVPRALNLTQIQQSLNAPAEEFFKLPVDRLEAQ